MRLAKLTIDNIKGVEHIEFAPGTLTVIRGANGSGKSSILDAVLAVFTGGSDPGWLRKGAKKGSVVMEIAHDDGRPAATITKTIAIKRSGEGVSTTLEILDPNGVPIPAPQTYIAKLGESWAVDPSSILNIDTSKAEGRKALIAKLLDIMPIRFERDELATALGGVAVTGLDIAAGCDLDGLAKAKKYIEDFRRRVGIEQKEAEGAVATLRKSLPEADDTTDWAARVRELEQERLALTQQESREGSEVQGAAATERQATQQDFAQKDAEIRAEFQRKLSELQDEKRKHLAAVDKAEREALEEIRTKHQPNHERIASEVATARERATQQTKAQGVRDSIKTFDQKAGAKACDYHDLTDTLERLDSLKKTKLESLPVSGLTFEGDQTLIDGVEWAHVNTQRRYTAAFEICGSKPGLMPFMVADNAEHFDRENWKDFEQAAIASGFQVIAAKVEAGPLAVERVA